jgi:hypothetical protein
MGVARQDDGEIVQMSRTPDRGLCSKTLSAFSNQLSAGHLRPKRFGQSIWLIAER